MSNNVLPRASIVIVTYNSQDYILECLSHVCPDPSLQVIVVDNLSTDQTIDLVSTKFPEVEIVRSAKNLGFAGGNNLGFTKCKSEYVLLLNPDAFLKGSDQIVTMIGVLERDKKIAFCGPQLLNEDGSHQVGDAGYADSITSLIGHFLFIHKVIGAFPATYLTNSRLIASDRVNVDWICGACLMTRRSTIEAIGGLDDSIFMYGEDVEWGERARLNGMGACYLPQTKVKHLQGAVNADGTVKVSNKWLKQRAKKFRKKGMAQLAGFTIIVAAGFLLRYVLYTVISIIKKEERLQRQAVLSRILLSDVLTGKVLG